MSNQGAIGPAGHPACGRPQQDLVLYLYGEMPEGAGDGIAGHVAACRSCADDLESFRSTLEIVDRSGIREATTLEPPLTWAALRTGLQTVQVGTSLSAPGRLLKAAAVVIVAGTAFLMGRYWDDVSPAGAGGSSLGRAYVPGPAGGPPLPGVEGIRPVPQDAVWRLRVFSEETNGYLDRTRLVLLEVTNADAGPESETLRRVSRTLLRESRHARQVAEKIDDRSLADLVGRLKGILEQIALMTDQNGVTALDQIRTQVNNSGVLVELEILSSTGEPWPTEKART